MYQKQNKNKKIQCCLECTAELYNWSKEETDILELYSMLWNYVTKLFNSTSIIMDQIKNQNTSYYVRD